MSAPRNEFELNESAPSYLFIAGGIGITPIRSMIKHVQETSAKPFKLYYLSRQPEITAYRDEFAASEYRGKAVIHHDYGDPEKSLDLLRDLRKQWNVAVSFEPLSREAAESALQAARNILATISVGESPKAAGHGV